MSQFKCTLITTALGIVIIPRVVFFAMTITSIRTKIIHTITLESAVLPKSYISGSLQKKLTNAVWSAPNDLVRMSNTMPGTVETSSNLAMVKSEKNKVTVRCLVRSFSESAKLALASRLESVFSLAGAEVELAGSYPGWQPEVNSEILEGM